MQPDQPGSMEPPNEQPVMEQQLLGQHQDNQQGIDIEGIQQTQKNSDPNPLEGVMNGVYVEDPKYMSRDVKKKKKKEAKKQQLISARRLKRMLRKKPVDKVRLAYQAYFFIVSVVVLTLSVISYRQQTVYEGDYLQFLSNVGSYVIDDIQFTYTNKNCKSQFGQDYSSLYEYDWPGTWIGCDCSQNFNFSSSYNIDYFFKENFMINRICSQAMLAQGCQTVNEQQQKTFNSWNDGSYGRPFVLCARRKTGVGLITNQTYCGQENKTVCGSGDNKFCVPGGMSCPISEIGFTTNPNYNNLSTTNNTAIGGIFDLGKEFYFYYIKNTSSLPLVEFRVTEWDKVCRRNLDPNISPNRVDYPLMITRRSQCENTDPLFQEIHSIDEEQFYLSNNVIYLSEKLPYFNIDTKYNWTLFAKSYIPWAPNCRGQLFDDVLSEGNTLSWVYVALRVELGVTIMYFIVIGLIFNIVGTMTACNFAWSCMTTRPDSQYNYIFIIEVGAKIIIQITEIIVIIVSFAILNGKRKVMKDVLDSGCVSDSDPVSQFFFSNLENDLTKFTWSYNLANLVIFAVTLILDVIIIKYSMNKGHHHGAKKHHEEDEHNKLEIASGGDSALAEKSEKQEKQEAKKVMEEPQN